MAAPVLIELEVGLLLADATEPADPSYRRQALPMMQRVANAYSTVDSVTFHASVNWRPQVQAIALFDSDDDRTRAIVDLFVPKVVNRRDTITLSAGAIQVTALHVERWLLERGGHVPAT